MKKRRTRIVIILVVAAMVVLIARRRAQLRHAPVYGQQPVPVHVAKATKGVLEKSHDYLSTVESWQSAQISSRIAARVIAVQKDEGDLVKSGELLLQLDDKDMQDGIDEMKARIAGAKASVASLETNHEYWVKENDRDSKLAEQGVIPRSAADATENHLAAAQAKFKSAQDNLRGLNHRLAALENNLSYTKLVSPFDGMVTKRDVDPGALATPGKPLMVVQDYSRLKLAFDAPQEDMAFLQEGMPVRIEGEGGQSALRITHMYPSLDHARMARIEVEAPAKAGLRIGAFAPVSVVLARHEDVVIVPAKSIVENPEGKSSVFLVKDGRLTEQPVKKIMGIGDRIEVEGVEPGDQVVTSTFLGWATLASGLKVEVVQ